MSCLGDTLSSGESFDSDDDFFKSSVLEQLDFSFLSQPDDDTAKCPSEDNFALSFEDFNIKTFEDLKFVPGFENFDWPSTQYAKDKFDDKSKVWAPPTSEELAYWRSLKTGADTNGRTDGLNYSSVINNPGHWYNGATNYYNAGTTPQNSYGYYQSHGVNYNMNFQQAPMPTVPTQCPSYYVRSVLKPATPNIQNVQTSPVNMAEYFSSPTNISQPQFRAFGNSSYQASQAVNVSDILALELESSGSSQVTVGQQSLCSPYAATAMASTPETYRKADYAELKFNIKNGKFEFQIASEDLEVETSSSVNEAAYKELKIAHPSISLDAAKQQFVEPDLTSPKYLRRNSTESFPEFAVTPAVEQLRDFDEIREELDVEEILDDKYSIRAKPSGSGKSNNLRKVKPIIEIREGDELYTKDGERREYLCVFCKGNNEPESVYTSHPIRVNGIVMCPFLRKHTCIICKDQGHTIKYCKSNKRGFFAMKSIGKADIFQTATKNELAHAAISALAEASTSGKFPKIKQDEEKSQKRRSRTYVRPDKPQDEAQTSQSERIIF